MENVQTIPSISTTCGIPKNLIENTKLLDLRNTCINPRKTVVLLATAQNVRKYVGDSPSFQTDWGLGNFERVPQNSILLIFKISGMSECSPKTESDLHSWNRNINNIGPTRSRCFSGPFVYIGWMQYDFLCDKEHDWVKLFTLKSSVGISWKSFERATHAL